ncbi:MAG: tripartite tricarboxylate transporter permease [Rhodobacteraceae bacterium]|nr:tripartite tricarboxylate transporter permease [Paracoccaceae bacterium]
MDNALLGLGMVADPSTIGVIILGVLIGVLVGALPGLSSPMAIALLIPFTISMTPISAVAMLAALYCAGTFGGSITAILINAPGAPPAAATALDGYPMAKRGEAGRALGLAAVSSVTGGVLSLLILLFAAPLLAEIAVTFTSAEYFALALFALSMLASISGKSSLRNLIAGALGVFLSTIGVHLTTGVERFNFGVDDLYEGVPFVPVLIGLFAVAELLKQARVGDVIYERVRANVMKLPSREDLHRVKWTILRSTGLGTFVGILPAEGATVAAIMGYNEARRWSKNKDEFGTGVPEGIAGPEAANNAATGGAMVPTLALGIPGSVSTALILGAMVMHGLKPGPFLLQNQPEFLYGIFAAMLVANLAFLVIGILGAKLFSQITLIPRTILWPSVLVFSIIGSYSAASSFFDVWVMVVAGIVGYFMLRFGFGPAPLIMGLVLGPIVEENFSKAMIVHDNSFLSMLERPIVLLFFALTIFSLAGPVIKAIRAQSDRKRLLATQQGE